jgi:hypothetical protein
MIKKYREFIGENHSSIEEICRKYGIQNYTINLDGSVDVEGNVVLSRMELTQLPLQFGKVSGNFLCNKNHLTSLKGSPSEVGGKFNCYGNQLTNLEGAPRKVGGDFYCSDNQLTTLDGAPREVGGDFDCRSNKIWNFIGPEGIGGNFYCNKNPIDVIYVWFKTPELVERATLLYPDLFKYHNGHWYIDTDILEQLAEDLKVELPADYQEQLKGIGYQIINI